MTADEFRALAVRLGAVVERPILDSIEFRVGNRTFATLGWPAAGWAVADQAKAVAHEASMPTWPSRRTRRHPGPAARDRGG